MSIHHYPKISSFVPQYIHLRTNMLFLDKLAHAIHNLKLDTILIFKSNYYTKTNKYNRGM